MELKITSRDGNSEMLITCVEKLRVKGQRGSFSFSCGVKDNSFSSFIENIWLDEEDIQKICDGLNLIINDSQGIFDSFPSFSDFIFKISKIDAQGHYHVSYIIEDKFNHTKQEGAFDVDLCDIEKMKKYFETFL